MGTLMEPGHVVDVFADGSQVVYNEHPILQLRDIAWFDGKLLAVDGESFRVLRFAPDRLTEEPFGDPQVRSLMRQMREERHFWRTLGSRHAFLLSALLLLAGIAAYARHRKPAARELIAAREGGGAAAQPAPLADLARQRMRIYGTARWSGCARTTTSTG